MGFRHEKKFYLNYMQYHLIQSKVKRVLPCDRYADQDGNYMIRSLYFDTPDNNLYRDKLDGVESRSKYRIRTYGETKSDRFNFEIKAKKGEYIQKEHTALTSDECRRLLSSDTGFLLHKDQAFAKQLYLKLKLMQLKPVVIVNYIREAYVFPGENVRITFDKDVKAAFFNGSDAFIENRQVLQPALPEGRIVLEVKFDHHLPSLIKDLILSHCSMQTAISKYVLGRSILRRGIYCE